MIDTKKLQKRLAEKREEVKFRMRQRETMKKGQVLVAFISDRGCFYGTP